MASAFPTVLQEFMCSLCLDYFKQPYTFLPCNHVYCKACLKRLRRGLSIHCPQCRCRMTGFCPDDFTAHKMRTTEVQCRMCHSKVPVSDVNNHMTHCSVTSDDFMDVVTDNTQGNVTREGVFRCPFCGQGNIKTFELLRHCVQHHKHERRKVVCPICASMPWGDPDFKSSRLVKHLELRHRFDYTSFTELWEMDENAAMERAVHESLTLECGQETRSEPDVVNNSPACQTGTVASTRTDPLEPPHDTSVSTHHQVTRHSANTQRQVNIDECMVPVVGDSLIDQPRLSTSSDDEEEASCPVIVESGVIPTTANDSTSVIDCQHQLGIRAGDLSMEIDEAEAPVLQIGESLVVQREDEDDSSEDEEDEEDSSEGEEDEEDSSEGEEVASSVKYWQHPLHTRHVDSLRGLREEDEAPCPVIGKSLVVVERSDEGLTSATNCQQRIRSGDILQCEDEAEAHCSGIGEFLAVQNKEEDLSVSTDYQHQMGPGDLSWDIDDTEVSYPEIGESFDDERKNEDSESFILIEKSVFVQRNDEDSSSVTDCQHQMCSLNSFRDLDDTKAQRKDQNSESHMDYQHQLIESLGAVSKGSDEAEAAHTRIGESFSVQDECAALPLDCQSQADAGGSFIDVGFMTRSSRSASVRIQTDRDNEVGKGEVVTETRGTQTDLGGDGTNHGGNEASSSLETVRKSFACQTSQTDSEFCCNCHKVC